MTGDRSTYHHERRESGLSSRNLYLMEHPLAFVIGVWAAVSGFVALALLAFPGLQDPAQQSALASLFPPGAELAWAVMYGIGGVLFATGIVRLSLRVEIAGCLLIAGTQLVNVYAIALVRGPVAGFVSGIGFAVALGLITRAVFLLRRRGL